MKAGWFVGDFYPAALKTSAAEVCYKTHIKGEYWAPHYHKEATEVTFVIRGILSLNGEQFYDGDIAVVRPGEMVTPEFITDVELIVIKTPSVPGDKYEV